MKIYISGPMTGLPEYNYPAFNTKAAELRALGFEVINPAELSTPEEHKQWRDYMREDIKALVDCDAITMLPNWQNSKGACLERVIAEGLGLIIYGEVGEAV